jgi:hypothetical protein
MPSTISLRRALLYSVSEIPLYTTQVIKGFFQNDFLLEVASINPFLVSIIHSILKPRVKKKFRIQKKEMKTEVILIKSKI